MRTNTQRSSNPSSITLLAALALLAIAPARVLGGAFEVLQQDARASGQAEAFIAQADDASAIYYNPAGLTQLEGTTFTGGVYGLFPYVHFNGPSGNESMSTPAVLPHLYAESDFGTDRFRFGFGLNNIFGLNEDWGINGPLNTLVSKTHLYLFNFEPTIAYRIDDHLSIGVGMNVYYGDLNLEHQQLLGPPPTPVGHFRFRGHDWAIGASPGVMWKIDERNTLAATYRSPFTIDAGGPATLTAPGIPSIGPSPSHAPIKLPQIAAVAYAVRPIQPWKLEGDVVWSNWGTFQQVRLASRNPLFNGMTIPTLYHDSWSFRFGTQYDLTQNWAVRAGYAYGTSAAPAFTYSPLVPDANYNLFSAGVGYSTPNWALDLAYLFIYRQTRHISGAMSANVDGTWDNQMHGIMLTFTAKL